MATTASPHAGVRALDPNMGAVSEAQRPRWSSWYCGRACPGSARISPDNRIVIEKALPSNLNRVAPRR